LATKKLIAIDGPAGAGKSTVAKALAKAMGYTYIDTGAMYRAVTLNILSLGIDPADEAAAAAAAAKATIVFKLSGDGKQRVFLNGQDVTNDIRSPRVDDNVSVIARLAGVRSALVRQQRKMAETGRVVMDGRDIGSTVLPGADLKIYLTASLAERTARRFQDMVAGGYKPDYSRLREDIRRRDEMDSRRENSPLQKAADAIIIDTSGKTVPEVIAEIMALCQQEG
jgi:cytidylate kinase